MKRLIVFFLLIFVLQSCSTCGPDILLGRFDLAEESVRFVPYTGNETLVFTDNEGKEHKLNSPKGKKVTQTTLKVKTTCDEGLINKQHLYYRIQREEVAFCDEFNNQLFYTDLTTLFEDNKNLDSIAIYDFLLVDSGINGEFNGQIKIITKERQNYVSSYHKDIWHCSEFIGDTIIYGREFKNVYKGNVNLNRNIYYNWEKGVIAFEISETTYWVLKN